MIRMIQSTSAGHAKAYFSDALLKSDYYLDGQEMKGRIQGRLAERLKIDGPASQEAFFALCENRHPDTMQKLTPRMKEERITGYDINFHCPKSVSLVNALIVDDHILKAFEGSVQETMLEIEADTLTRVRKGKTYADRQSGEMIWADFTHLTSRPVDGQLPDPHLHSHCFVFNAVWDPKEQRVKAGKFRQIKRDMPFYQARFQKRLADKLIEVGYQIRRTENSFEIKAVPQMAIDLFSKRTDEIGRIAKQQGIHDAKSLDGLGARTRSKKQKGHSISELRKGWRLALAELGDAAKAQTPIRFAPRAEQEKQEPGKFIKHAVKHCFERASVVHERKILETACRDALGQPEVPLADLQTAFQAQSGILKVRQGGLTLCTTKEVLNEEKRMVELAQEGRNRFDPLYSHAPTLSNMLNDQQREFVKKPMRCQLNIHSVLIS